MLSIILTILKIVGIILLSILGILLILIAAILWVPFRYRIRASKYEEVKANVRLSWLFRIIYVTFGFEGGKTRFVIRLFGFPIIDSNRPKKTRKKKSNKKKQKKQRVQTKQESIKSLEQKEPPESKNELAAKNEEPDTEKEPDTSEAAMKKSIEDQKVSEEAVEKIPKTKHGMKYRIRQILTMIKTIPSKVMSVLQKIRSIIKTIMALPQKIGSMKKRFKDFLWNEESKSALLTVLKSMMKLLKHASPKRIKGKVTFGLDDPCTTGKVLGAVSIAYTYLNLKKLKIYPDFNQSVFEGEVDARGRVYTATVLHIVIKLLRDKQFTAVRNRFKQFKEE